VGAGALPLSRLQPRPPIPIVGYDEAAAARVPDPLGAWLAGLTGTAPTAALRFRRIVVAGDVVPATARGAGLGVPQVALAVDTGRELAAAASRQGVTVLVGEAPGHGGDVAALAVALGAGGRSGHGPLGALRRHGDGAIAVLCGLALGAGEHGLGFVADDAPAAAGAAVAAGVEPDLLPRLRAGREPRDAGHRALLAHLGLTPGVDEAALRSALRPA
jgi:nicotinate-nucleotide--dimethylbenzimidazole phosphoribosyltransferase